MFDPSIDWSALRGLNVADTDAPRLGVYGDSTALMTGFGLNGWATAHLDQLNPYGGGWANLGCGTISGAERRFRGEVVPAPAMCDDWQDSWADAVASGHPDVAVIQLGAWEVADTRMPGDDRFRSLGDRRLDAAVEESLRAGVDRLIDGGAVVVLLTSPTIEAGRVGGRAPDADLPENDPDRMARWNDILTRVATDHPEVAVVDLAGWVARQGDDDSRLRPDGIHFTADTTLEAAEWLGPEIVEAAARMGITETATPPPAD